MHFDKFASPTQALSAYKKAKSMQLESLKLKKNDAFQESSIYVESSPSNKNLYSYVNLFEPCDASIYRIYFPEIVEGFENYLKLRFGCLIDENWFLRTLCYFGQNNLLKFLELIPDTTQLILLPTPYPRKSIVFIRVNFTSLEYEVNELELFFDPSSADQFSNIGGSVKWNNIGNSLTLFPSDQYRFIPARQILASIFYHINQAEILRNELNTESKKILINKHLALNTFEGREWDRYLYDDHFFEIYILSRNWNFSTLLPYKNPFI
ncbi:hypothetical protein U2E72_13295 [Acinetobacter baumannii]|uniref:hypothetical protein n=1 Tax=Acinetobacter baumannii TaxID=470 RepID=UPI00338F4968